MDKQTPETKSKRSRFLPIPLGLLGGIVPALLRNWKLGIFGLLIGVIVYQNFVPFEFLKPIGLRTVPGVIQDVQKAENKISILEDQNQACELGREKLKVAIETTNAQIEKWVNLSQKLQANQTKLNAELIALKKQNAAEIEQILNEPTPKTCKGAVNLLKDAVINGDLSWRKDG